MTGTGAKAVALNPAQRAGIFTQLAFLTAHADTGDSHPVKRGDALLRRLLCMELEVPDQHRGAAGGRAQRHPDHARALRRARRRRPAPRPATSCWTRWASPSSRYDAIGTYRTTDRNKPVDTTGSLTLPSGTPLTFKDAADLVSKLAKLPEVQDCMTTQWMRYMLGRREVEGEAPSLDVLRDAVQEVQLRPARAAGRHDPHPLVHPSLALRRGGCPMKSHNWHLARRRAAEVAWAWARPACRCCRPRKRWGQAAADRKMPDGPADVRGLPAAVLEAGHRPAGHAAADPGAAGGAQGRT